MERTQRQLIITKRTKRNMKRIGKITDHNCSMCEMCNILHWWHSIVELEYCNIIVLLEIEYYCNIFIVEYQNIEYNNNIIVRSTDCNLGLASTSTTATSCISVLFFQ